MFDREGATASPDLAQTPEEMEVGEIAAHSVEAPHPLAVLLVEDSDDDAALLLRVLRRGGYDLTAERVDTCAAMSAVLTSRHWDVILADYSLPQFSGPAALTLLQERPAR